MFLRPGSAIPECAGATPSVLSTERSAKFTPVGSRMHASTGYFLIPVLRLREGPHPLLLIGRVGRVVSFSDGAKLVAWMSLSSVRQ